MDLLQPVIRPYAWGSRHGIAELQGRPVPAPGPEAELWMGAHQSAPSGVERDGRAATLDEIIAADPARELGPQCVARFGSRLPFLLKVLSAAKALSIQVHPSRAQAQAGFAAENERGLPPGDPARNYVDDWPKPELLCALTPFEVLAGLRDPADAAAFLRALDVPELRPLAAGLADAAEFSAAAFSGAAFSGAAFSGAARLSAASGSTAAALSAAAGIEGSEAMAGALASILCWPAESRERLVGDVAAACARLAQAGGPYAAACAAAVRVAGDHPGDLGVAALPLLRHAVLLPGQAVFMPAGGLHAYLHGTGIEVLANSDNVVRAGLTGKHVDVPELLKLLDPAIPVPVLSPRQVAAGVSRWETPAPEFGLYRVDPGAEVIALPGAGPRIVLCTDGSVALRAESGDTVKVSRGESCFVSAADGAVAAAGPARAFVACVGELS
jgi:mannose-6-phosphate isomerase